MNSDDVTTVVVVIVVLMLIKMFVLTGCDCGCDCGSSLWCRCDRKRAVSDVSASNSASASNSTDASNSTSSSNPTSALSEGMTTPAGPDSAPTLYYHYTTWCGYCKKMRPLWDEVKAEMSSSAFFIEVDEDVTHTPSITSYPTVVAHINGEKVTYSGGYTKAELKKFVMQAIEMKNGMKNRGQPTDMPPVYQTLP